MTLNSLNWSLQSASTRPYIIYLFRGPLSDFHVFPHSTGHDACTPQIDPAATPSINFSRSRIASLHPVHVMAEILLPPSGGDVAKVVAVEGSREQNPLYWVSRKRGAYIAER